MFEVWYEFERGVCELQRLFMSKQEAETFADELNEKAQTGHFFVIEGFEPEYR